MNTTTRTLAGLSIASAAVTVALVAPANAMPVPAPVDPPAAGHGVHRHLPTEVQGSMRNARVAEYQSVNEARTRPPAATSTLITDDSNVDWAQVAYGAAGGIALTTAAGASLILLRRRQHLPSHS